MSKVCAYAKIRLRRRRARVQQRGALRAAASARWRHARVRACARCRRLIDKFSSFSMSDADDFRLIFFHCRLIFTLRQFRP
jgi:hypothetical protein